MPYETIKYELDKRILTITLNRPEKLNAFTIEMSEELIDAFTRASADDAVGAIVVTGEGRAFCAGMDLSVRGNRFGLDDDAKPTLEDMNNRLDDPHIEQGVRDSGGRVTLAIYECNKPVIAAINGPAVGIGATMTCAMDVRYASESAKIGFVFNKIGLVPEACSSWFLPRIVGMGKALEWIYRADVMPADELLQGGLLSAVVPADDLLDKAYELANTLAQRSPVAIAITRQMLYRNASAPHPMEAHKLDSLGIFYTNQIGAREGIKAFLEKRDPVYADTISQDMPDFYPWWK